MVVNNALHDRQSESGAAGAARAVAAHKRLEQVFPLFGLDARPVVFHLKPRPMLFRTAANLNPTVSVAGGVHHHIGERALDRERVHFQLNAAWL